MAQGKRGLAQLAGGEELGPQAVYLAADFLPCFSIVSLPIWVLES